MNQSPQKLIRYGFLATLLTPLFFTPFTYFPWHFGKTIIFQMLVELLVVAWIIFVWAKPSAITPGATGLKKLNPLDWSILIFLLVITLTALTGINFQNSWWGNFSRVNGVFTWWHFGLWYWFAVYVLHRGDGQKHENFSLTISVAAAVVLSFTIFLERYLPDTWQSGAGGGLIGNRAFAAAYLIAALGLAVYSAVVRQNRFVRIGFSLAAIVVLMTLVGLHIRGAWVGLGVGVLVALVWLAVNHESKQIRRGCWIGLTAAGVVLAGLVVVAYTQGLAERFPRLAQLTSISAYATGTGETRLRAWRIGLAGWRDKPVLGWGWGNYEAIFSKYYDPQFLKYSFTETVWDKPHNWFLEIGDAAGIIGAISYLGIFAAALYCAWKSQPRTGAGMLIAGLAAYFVQDLFLFETTNGLLLFFLLLALISTHFKTGPSEHPETILLPKQPPKNEVPWWVRGSGCLLILFSLYEWNFRSLQAGFYLNEAMMSSEAVSWSEAATQTLASAPNTVRREYEIFLAQRLVQLYRSQADVTAPITASTTEAVATQLTQEFTLHPQSVAYAVWAGQLYSILGEKVDSRYFANAEKMLLAASNLSPNKQDILILLGRLYLLKQDFAKALAATKQAVDAAPNIAQAHWFLGLNYVAAGQLNDGLNQIEAATERGYELTTDEKLYVLDLYAQAKRYDKLIAGYSDLIATDPQNVNWYIKLAVAYALGGNKPKALETVDQAVHISPDIKPEAEDFIKKYHLQ